MSDSDEDYYPVDSPPSPTDLPSPGTTGGEEENDSDDCVIETSPPSSPVRRGRKRRAYTGDLKSANSNRNSSGAKRTLEQDADHVEDCDSIAGDQDMMSEEECLNPHCDKASCTVCDGDKESESDGSIDMIQVSSSDEELSSDDRVAGAYNDQELSDSDGDHEDPFNDSKLYPGSEKTTDEAIYELINIYLCNNLSQTALKDFLKFYSSSLPPLHNMPSSHHRLLKHVQDLSVPLCEIEHYYCRPEMHFVASRTGPCDCGASDIGVFFELPLDKRIKFLFEHRGLADVIDKYSAVRNEDNGSIKDVLDGSEYTRVWEGRCAQYKVTLILNTDGVSPHKSSNAKFWPLLFTFMEIPPELRSSFTVVWGLWFDKKLKPNMNRFLKPFVASLEKIAQEGGVLWQHPRTKVVHRCPVCCCLLVADAPARANCLNMQEHQAKYACPFCHQKTNKLPAPPPVVGAARQRPRKRRFLFQENPSPLRTHQGMINDGKLADDRNQPKKGHKGSTVLEYIPSINLSTCVVAEYMHCVLIGVVKQICSLWFFVPGDWFIGNHVSAMNEFLNNDVHPPDFVSRLPRSFEYFAKFKANEFRSFLLYFSLILVSPYQKDMYLQHWMLLVQSIFLLLSDSISETDCIAADAMIRLFVRDLGALYGNEQYVYNVHQLVHLVLHVRRWGPLWATSAFSFENFNGILSKMLHGSKNEGQELLNQLFLAQGAQILKNKIVSDARTVRHLEVLGKPLQYVLSDAESLLLNNRNVVMSDLQYYGRILIGRELFSSEQYDRQFRRRNSYVEFQVSGQKKYGRIIVFCKSGQLTVCLVKVFRVDHTKFFFHTATMNRIKHIVPVEDSGEVIACSIVCIDKKLIQVGDFLCCRPNSVESNL